MESLIRRIVELELSLFRSVNNVGGRASCQDDQETFRIMRRSQFSAWPKDALRSYLDDLERAAAEGRNPVSEKYAYMMESTHPREFGRLADQLPAISEEKRLRREEIIEIFMEWEAELVARFPHIKAQGRSSATKDDGPCVTSVETYLRGELSTYSLKTLRLYGAFVALCRREGTNLALRNVETMASSYGYESLEEAENRAASMA